MHAMIQYSKSWNSRKIVELNPRLHASQAGGDDHFTPWGDLLTNLECDPPIIVQFPFYLLMCQSFTLEPIHLREDYVYTALTGVDWVSRTDAYLHTALTSNRLGVKASLANALKTYPTRICHSCSWTSSVVEVHETYCSEGMVRII